MVERREKAFGKAMRLLSSRERSAVEIQQRLRQEGYDAETVHVTLDRLQSSGLQDDRRFAEGVAASSIRSRGLASRVIQSDLRRRGIDKELAARAATRSPEEEEQTARALAQKRAGQLSGYPRDVQVRRLGSFLARRGYGAELCASLVEEALGPPARD
ncbi:MAG: regulatory protein RecX [Actinomycetota bacterium]|nr:recombination regulator RecX [Actinomycetota bacterium]